MKPLPRRILLGLTFVGLGIQFLQPERNSSAVTAGPQDITVLHPTAPEVKQLLARACYDCHSDNTRYPWYARIQPAGWWLAHHVKEGKQHLNFSQFGTYSPQRAAHKIEELIEQVEQREMPLRSYTLLHREARLTEPENAALQAWAQAIGRQLPAP